MPRLGVGFAGIDEETSVITITANNLDEFVQESDRLGGPGAPACDAYWQGLSYATSVVVDETLDPFGDAYVAQQMAVYEEISGRTFDQEVNEHSVIEIARHIGAANPYDHPDPGGLAVHLQRLSRAISLAAPPKGGAFLDMGCGWGLSSEIAAYCGMNVTSVDINPDFVRLVETRARNAGLSIVAQQGTFDGFSSERRFDAILFYECLHHALRLWTVLDRMARLLTVDGRIILAGEPINAIWWQHWGMRLDPLSLYCIRKFGWFESGWSVDFVKRAFEQVGLECRIWESPETGYTVIGERSARDTSIAVGRGAWSAATGWFEDGEFLTSKGDSTLTLELSQDAKTARIALHNFRGADLALSIYADDRVIFDGQVPPGENQVDVEGSFGDSVILRFSSETWCPDDEIANGDHRLIGVHLRTIDFAAQDDKQ